MTVAELGQRVSSAEFAEWLAYYRLEPFGALRGDLQAGLVASMIGNVHRRRGAKPLGPSDFLMFQDRQDNPGDVSAAIDRHFTKLEKRKNPPRFKR